MDLNAEQRRSLAYIYVYICDYQRDYMKLLYQDLTYKIRGAYYKVYKEFGRAFKEKLIQNALQGIRRKRIKYRKPA